MTRDSLPPTATGEQDETLARERAVMTVLLRSQAVTHGDLATALAEITEAAARLLGVRRVSVWRVGQDRARIDCLDLYDAVLGTHTSGATIHAKDAPAYFAAALTERCIAADDAREDPRTREFRAGYLEPEGITSMLDAPILVRGEVVGVICHEHVGPKRAWAPWEELAAGTLADVVGMAMSAAVHVAQNRELQALRGNLEKLVDERTRELTESREAVRRLFAASPVALALTRTDDHVVLLANDRAAELFEIEPSQARGARATTFWARTSDREAMLAKLGTDGVVDGFEAELQTSRGRSFWGLVSATSLVFEGERAMLVGIHDVTERRAAAEALRTMLDASPIPLVVTGLDDAVVRFSNKRAADMFGIGVDEMVGTRALDFYVDPDERHTFVRTLRDAGRVEGFATRLRTRDGREFWALLSARTMTLHGDRVFMVGFSDLTEQKETEHRLRDLASLDSLTGAYNRRHFYEAAQVTLAVAERRGKGGCVAILDLDHFKNVNDEHGHAVGDEVLKAFARVCQKECRASDLFARYGGEEFVVLLPETNIDSARAVVERMRHALAAEALATPSGTVRVTVSVGVAERRPGESLDALLGRADAALYEAKGAGRNRVVCA